MNKIIITPADIPILDHKEGDLFISDICNEIYILINYSSTQYVCIALSDGRYHSDPCDLISKAIKGLKFFGRNADITIKLTN